MALWVVLLWPRGDRVWHRGWCYCGLEVTGYGNEGGTVVA